MVIHENGERKMCFYTTHDIPANSLAVGNPCRVIREITQEQ